MSSAKKQPRLRKRNLTSRSPSGKVGRGRGDQGVSPGNQEVTLIDLLKLVQLRWLKTNCYLASIAHDLRMGRVAAPAAAGSIAHVGPKEPQTNAGNSSLSLFSQQQLDRTADICYADSDSREAEGLSTCEDIDPALAAHLFGDAEG